MLVSRATPVLLAAFGFVLTFSLGSFAVVAGDPRFDGKAEQARGFYSDGSLVNANALEELENESWTKLQRPRNLHYGTYDLIQILEASARELHSQFPGGEPLQIGDIARKNGGLLPASEVTKRALSASHQNGLDVDLVFYRVNHRIQDPQDTKGFQENFVVGGKASKNLDVERNWALLKILHETGRLERVFMATPIKNAFCAYARKIGEAKTHEEVLRALRKLESHDDHMHVRISCPRKSPNCTPQEPVPAGSGC